MVEKAPPVVYTDPPPVQHANTGGHRGDCDESLRKYRTCVPGFLRAPGKLSVLGLQAEQSATMQIVANALALLEKAERFGAKLQDMAAKDAMKDMLDGPLKALITQRMVY